jgi:hypothetical protein
MQEKNKNDYNIEGNNKPISQGYVCNSSLSPSQAREESDMHDGLGLACC